LTDRSKKLHTVASSFRGLTYGNNGSSRLSFAISEKLYMGRESLVLENNRLDMGVRQGFSAKTAENSPDKVLFAGIPQIG